MRKRYYVQVCPPGTPTHCHMPSMSTGITAQPDGLHIAERVDIWQTIGNGRTQSHRD